MDDFSKNVLREIQEKGITPRPVWYFLIRRSVFWTLATFSILVGATALSIAHYIFFDNEDVSSAVLMRSPLGGVVDMAPLLWLLLFGLFVLSAYLSVKNTQGGYRYDTLKAVVGVAAFTIFVGAVLSLFDFGHAIYYYLTHSTSFWQALVQTSDDIPLPF